METKILNGMTCVVIHLAAEPSKLTSGEYIAACNGDLVSPPSQNDRRPQTPCDACMRKVREYALANKNKATNPNVGSSTKMGHGADHTTKGNHGVG